MRSYINLCPKQSLLVLGLAFFLGATSPVVVLANEIAEPKGMFPESSVDFSKVHAGPSVEGISPDGLMRAETEFQKVKVWSVPDNKLLHEFSTPDRSFAPTFTPDSSTLVVALCKGNLGCAGTFQAWNLKTKEKTELGKCNGTVFKINFSADGSRLAAVTSYSSIVATLALERKKWLGGELIVLDLKSGAKPFNLAWEAANVPLDLDPEEITTRYYAAIETHMPHQVILNHDGSKLMTVMKDGGVSVFDVETGKRDFAAKTIAVQADAAKQIP